jgi:hypothetical protein
VDAVLSGRIAEHPESGTLKRMGRDRASAMVSGASRPVDLRPLPLNYKDHEVRYTSPDGPDAFFVAVHPGKVFRDAV